MGTTGMREARLESANREWWSVQLDARLDQYQAGVPSLAGDRVRFSSLEWCAQRRVWDAFYVLAAGLEHLAHAVSDYVMVVAEEALQSESFERQFRKMKTVPESNTVVEDDSFQPSALHVSIERASGRANCLEALHYARWFRTGTRPMDLWAEMLIWRRQYYELMVKQYMKLRRVGAVTMLPLMRGYVEGANFREAVDLYRRDYEKPLRDWPPTRAAGRSQVHVLYLLALHGLGETDVLDVVRACVQQWHRRSHDWTSEPCHSPLLDQGRLAWAYLWQAHFGGITEFRALLDELRGY